MTTTYLGGKTLGSAMPEVATALVEFIAPIQAQIDGIIAAQARVALTPPSLSANLSVVQELVASLEAAIALGLPTLDFQLTAMAGLLVALEAQLAAIAALQAALGAGVDVYAYLGPAGTIGLAGEVPPSATTASLAGAIILVATTPAARAAIGGFFGASL